MTGNTVSSPAGLRALLAIVALLALAFPGAATAAVSIDAVYFAQTHVHQPNHAYFSLVGGKDILIKAHVVDPAMSAAPAVTATLTLGTQSTNLTLTGPATLPASIPNGFGVVQHSFTNTFTNRIPKAWAKSGLTVQVQAGAVSTNFTNLKIGAPTKVIMTMTDVHYFAQTSGDYPSGWQTELEAKWPVADLELRRLRNVVFPELVIPPRSDVGAPAVRIRSKAEYTEKTGLAFDGEQAAALKWNGALKAAAGTAGRISLYYLSIYGANAGGQAGGFAGVGGGTSIGILHHELGHALSLPHWGDNGSYPYKGDMYGIQAPAIYNDTHAGPVWAYDPVGRTFLPCTVQPGNVGGKPTGTYKADPMQGGGTGFQESGYLMNHFSDYSVNQMRSYLESHVLIWNTNLQKYASWNSTTKDYTSTVTTNGVNYPVERDVNVISILASVSGASPEVCMVYPPIGPYLGSLIRTFDPSVAADRTAAASIFAPAGGCDVCVRVVQGGVTNTYMLAASWDTAADPLAASSLQTAAVNLRASNGTVTKIELLYTPNAQVNGLPANPTVLYTWPGYLGAKSYYWDNNGATAGFGTASGTWAAPTTGDSTQGWSTNAAGSLLPGSVTVTEFDEVNFGNGTNGLAAGTINVTNTVVAGTVEFASGSGAIMLNGGTIAAASIIAQNTGNTINSAISFSGQGRVSFSRNTSAVGSLSLNGPITGSSGLTFTTPDVNSGNYQQTITLGTATTYVGTTEITTGNSGNTLWVRAGVTNALPPATVLLLNGGPGSGSGRTVAYDLNGFPQTLAGLTNVAGLTLRNQRVLNSSTNPATLTVSNTASFTFGGTLGNGGTNLGLTKTGAGTLTLTAANTYGGATTVGAGTLAFTDVAPFDNTSGITLAGSTTLRPIVDGAVIGAPITIVSGMATINASTINTGAGTNSLLTLNGAVGGAGGVTFNSSVNINNWATILLNAPATYAGNTLLDTSGGTACQIIVKLGTHNALPTNTVVTIDGQTGAGSGRIAEINLNGFNQELAGLANVTRNLRIQRVVNSDVSAPAILTINNSNDFTFSGRLGGNGGSVSGSAMPGSSNGNNFGLTKDGPGVLNLTYNNTYTGDTTVNGGTLKVLNAYFSTNSTVRVAAGAVLQLDFAVTNIVTGFITNGVPLAAGVYKAANVGPFIAGTGSLEIIGAGPVAPAPAHLTNSLSGSTLTFTWPAGQNWRLVGQTNSLSSGLNPATHAWFTVPGGIDGSNSIAIDPATPAVFYRLVYP